MTPIQKVVDLLYDVRVACSRLVNTAAVSTRTETELRQISIDISWFFTLLCENKVIERVKRTKEAQD